jgi:hypothetical protein
MWCLKNNIPYVECSAKDDLNIEQAFCILVEGIFSYEKEVIFDY